MFYLKSSPDKRGNRLIVLAFNYHSNRFRLSTDLKINPDQWDTKRERPKRGFKYYPQFVAVLDNLEKRLHEAYYESILTHIPTKAELKAAIQSKAQKPKSLTVAEYAARFAETKTGVRPATIQQFKIVARNLADFDPKLTFDKIDLGVMLDFKEFLSKKISRVGQQYSQNSVAGYFKRFKTILNDATEKGVNTNLKYRTRKAKAEWIETTAIFLNEMELEQIRSAELPDYLDKYRDIMLLLCYTGTRFTDIWKIDRTSFVEGQGIHYFRITDKKENATAQIPAHPIVLDILNKYDWNIPKVSNVKFNLYVKEVGRLAKIDQDINVTKFPGSERKDKKCPKYQMITAHTGRRSLICNLILAGVNRETIKSISGHRTDSAFQKYVRLTPSDHLAVAFKSSFFALKNKVI